VEYFGQLHFPALQEDQATGSPVRVTLHPEVDGKKVQAGPGRIFPKNNIGEQ